MSLKEKLIVVTSGIIMVLCVLFVSGLVANGMGNGNYDVAMLLRGIDALRGILQVYGGMP